MEMILLRSLAYPKIEESTHGSLTFLANPKYAQYIYTTNASLVIVNEDFKLENEIDPTLIRVTDAYQAFSTLLEFYTKNDKIKKGIESTSIIDKSTNIHSSCYIGSFSIIGKNVRFGKNILIAPHVIEDNVSIGDNTKIESFVQLKMVQILDQTVTFTVVVLLVLTVLALLPKTMEHIIKFLILEMWRFLIM